MLVRDVMTREVATLNRNDELSLADDVMRLGRIRHLPVIDESTGEVAGVLSQRDLFAGALARAFGYGSVAQRRVLKTIVVKEVMTTEVVTATPDMSLQEAARLMLERKIGCLVVLEDGKLAGILTESDFVALTASADEAD
jgi:CBS domain-containing membrane protein